MQNATGSVHCANTAYETDNIETVFAMVVSRLFTTVMPTSSVLCVMKSYVINVDISLTQS